MKLLRLLPVVLFLSSPAVWANEPAVVVSIKPLRWLVETLAPPGTAITTLVPDAQSPHDYQLRPADVARIQQAALLVWTGPGMEPWLDATADRLPAEKNLALLPFSLHSHDDHKHGDHSHEVEQPGDAAADPHLWLDPAAMAEKAGPVADSLKRVYPAQASVIDSNLAQFRQQMQVLDAELAAQFAPVAKQGFVVYHDGYQRLVQRYHLNQKAAVWQHESIPPGARERAGLLKLLASGEVQCLFYEPEHGADAVSGWLGGASDRVKLVEIDMLGTAENDYSHFLRGLAGKMVGCLASAP